MSVVWATGDTPPIEKPVDALTKSASARPSVPTSAATFCSSTRRSPEVTTRTAASSDVRRNTMLLAIWPSSTPRADAASAAVRPVTGSITTSWGWPSSASRRCDAHGAVGEWSLSHPAILPVASRTTHEAPAGSQELHGGPAGRGGYPRSESSTTRHPAQECHDSHRHRRLPDRATGVDPAVGDPVVADVADAGLRAGQAGRDRSCAASHAPGADDHVRLFLAPPGSAAPPTPEQWREFDSREYTPVDNDPGGRLGRLRLPRARRRDGLGVGGERPDRLGVRDRRAAPEQRRRR